MACSKPTSLRFLGLLKQPVGSDHNPLEFDEADVYWSFFPSSDGSYSVANSPSPPSVHHYPGRRFNPIQSGLSAALGNNQHHLMGRKSNIIPAAARPDSNTWRFHQSAPVNIPVWPRKLQENQDNMNGLNKFDAVDEDDEWKDEDEGEMVPPHVIVARSHATFSVFEGVGRTLKGRDLRRVRNAVFQKTGFID